MLRLRDLPIRQKLVLIVMLAIGGALVLASVGLIAAELVRSKRELGRDLEILADIVAYNSNAAVAFEDPRDAKETLESLRARATIVSAAIYDSRGRVFAEYHRPGDHSAPRQPPPDGTHPGEDSLTRVAPVLLEDERLGTVYLESDLRPVYSRLRTQGYTVAGVLLIAALAALVLSSLLQRVISRPILALAATARAVSERQDYSLRATREGADELGQLVNAFNGMLAQIETRDEQLQAAKAELELRVAERTRELEQELGERRRAEQELADRNLELDRSNRELDDFAYIASHDLKEPLRGIHNFSVFLLEDYAGKLDAEGREKLETLTRLSRRMETLIDTLLHFSRVGRLDLAIDRVDLNEIVAAVTDSLAISLRESNAEVRLPRPLPVVRCDRARVGEIFSNLIINAVKYNDKEHKLVEIGVVGKEGSGRRRGDPEVFYVRDNGIGIPAKHFESVFRIFKRLHGRDQFGGGTGAGLTIVKKIVERHGGRIWIESTPGKGTTFYFTLEGTSS
jgi:signal transduction histidine kinase